MRCGVTTRRRRGASRSRRRWCGCGGRWGRGRSRPRRTGIAWCVPGDEIDSHRFERLVTRARELDAMGAPDRAAHLFGEALALWRGPPLAGSGRLGAGPDRGRPVGGAAPGGRGGPAGRRRCEPGATGDVLAEAQGAGRRAAAAGASLGVAGVGAVPVRPAGRRVADAPRGAPSARRGAGARSGTDVGGRWRRRSCVRIRRSAAAPALPEPSATCPYRGLVPYDLRAMPRRSSVATPSCRSACAGWPTPACWWWSVRPAAASRRSCGPGSPPRSSATADESS